MSKLIWPGVAILCFAVAPGDETVVAQNVTPKVVISGPVGPSPYEVVRGWAKPFAAPGFAFGGNSGVFADNPNRIIIAQRGETRLPNPVPPGFLGFAGSIGINVLLGKDAASMRVASGGPALTMRDSATTRPPRCAQIATSSVRFHRAPFGAGWR